MADENELANGTATQDGEPHTFPSNSGAEIFAIRVKGQLNSHWSEWLDGLEVKLSDNGEMILLGPIVDQAALMGVLNKLNGLNLALLSVNKIIATE